MGKLQVNGTIQATGSLVTGSKFSLTKNAATKSTATDQDLVINYNLPSGTSLTDSNAPGIGFHVGNTCWGQITYNNGFKFYDGGSFSSLTNVYANNFIGNLSGNAFSASKLQTARTISLTGSVTGSGSFDGSGNLSISTATNHTHDSLYVNVSGDTMTGNLIAPTYIATQKMTISSTGLVDLTTAGTTRLYADGIAISNPSTKNDDAWIRVTGTSELDTILEIATGDDGGGAAGNGPEQIVVRQYGANGLAHQVILMDTSGNTSTSGTITASSFIGNLNGNASSATNADKLDGYHASSFALSGHTHNYLPWNVYAGATDFNTVTTTAFNSMCATGGANQPNANHGLLITDFNVGTPIQIWYPDLSMAMYKRYRSSGTWSAWSNTWDINISGTAATANSVAWGNVTGKPSLMPGTPGSIELYPGSSAGHGGFIDFHYNNSSSDYTARIINWNGTLQVSGATFNVGGKVELWSDSEGGNIRITSPNGSLWSIDALENSKLRFIWAEAQVPFSFQHDGVFNCAAIATSAWGPSLPGSGYWGQVFFKT